MLGLGVNKLWTSSGQKDGYAVLSQKAPLVAAFEDEYYRTNGAQTTFSDLITHARAGNATMTDSDGLIKWAPHNLVTYSEQFESVNWTEAASSADDNQGVAPDGTNTAALFAPNVGTVNAYIYQGSVGLGGLSCTMALWVKSDGATWVRLTNKSASDNKAYFNLSTGTIGTVVGGSASIADAGDGWYFIKFEIASWASSASTDYIFGITDADNTVTHTSDGTNKAYIWGAHTYRSDLGGMVDNPDRGDSYVPTTSSAVYLPRRGHHVYNGYEWVNEGVLAESESRTNLLTYFNDWAQWTTLNSVSSSSATLTPDGNANAVSLAGNGTSAFPNLGLPFTIASASTATFSVFVKQETSGYAFLRVEGSNVGGSTSTTAEFDFSTEILKYRTGGTADAHHVQKFANGWYRIAVTCSADSFSGVKIYPDFNSVNTNSTLFYGAQVEEAATPSSLIPTSGSTVSRAAETFTIPSAKLPWPTPQYIGGELVTNGTFDTDSDWTKDANWTIASGVATSTTSAGGIYQAITCEVGKIYFASIDITSAFSGGVVGVFQIRNSTNTTSIASFAINDGTTGTKTVAFVATETTHLARVYVSGTAGAIDAVSVREINPLSVSIQMDGRMTYADEGSAATGFFFKWLYDNNNLIQIRLDTDSGSGDILFTQGIGGVYDSVELTSALSPDILVPYNIASRHGSVFVNGAVDGTALTANTTPVALPDLSATDLDLANDYMGTIKTFRMWDKDLGDTGIATATEPSLEPSLSLSFDSTESSFVDLGWSE